MHLGRAESERIYWFHAEGKKSRTTAGTEGSAILGVGVERVLYKFEISSRSPLIEGIHPPKTQGSVDVWHCISSSRDNDQNDTYHLPHNYMAQLVDALFSLLVTALTLCSGMNLKRCLWSPWRRLDQVPFSVDAQPLDCVDEPWGLCHSSRVQAVLHHLLQLIAGWKGPWLEKICNITSRVNPLDPNGFSWPLYYEYCGGSP